MTDTILIFDTTLRDGEQSPGCSMNLEEKLQVAVQLETMGVDIIEAGFAIASIGDFEAVSEVARQCKSATVASLARAAAADIDRAWEAVQHAIKPRIHTFIATSPLHMRVKLNKTPDEVIEAIDRTVRHARNICPDVEWSAEDATRSDPDFLARAIEIAISAGARTINLPDTVGYATPETYGAMFRDMINRVPNADLAVFSTHCHNDLGLAVANSLAAVMAGARQVESTINGIGERAGNAAVEEIAMALKVRHDVMPVRSNIVSTEITRASRLISGITGFQVQPNKAIVGANAFAHESGIHQDGMIKDASTYEIMTPESVGLTHSSLVMGKHSGRAAFRQKLEELGYALGDNAFQDAFARFKDLADAKKAVYDEDIVALVDDEVLRGHDAIQVKEVEIYCGSNGPAARDPDARDRWRGQDRDEQGQRPGRRPLQRDPHDRAARQLDHGAIRGPCRHRRHRRTGGSLGAAVRERPYDARPGRASRYDGGVSARLCECAQQDDGEAREIGARRAGQLS